MNNHFLLVMIGIPASGKSTWAENIKKEYDGDCEIVSRDSIRFSMDGFSKDTYFKNEKKVYDIYIEKIKESLIKNKITIADATHVNNGSRHKLFYYLSKKISNDSYKVIYMFADTKEKECLRRNAYRNTNAIVPEEAIKHLYNDLRVPPYTCTIRLSQWKKHLWHSKDTIGKKKLRDFMAKEDAELYGGCSLCKHNKSKDGITICEFGGCNGDHKADLWEYKHTEEGENL